MALPNSEADRGEYPNPSARPAATVIGMSHLASKLPIHPAIRIFRLNTLDANVAQTRAPSQQASFGESEVRALAAFSSLGQQTRLSILRLLVSVAPEGIAVSDLALRMKCPQNTMSGHLAIMARAQLVRGERRGRTVIYAADLIGVRWLIEYLLTDCCNGHPSACGTLLNDLKSSKCLHPSDQVCGADN